MGLAGKDAKVQIRNQDNNNAWNELAVNFDASINFGPELLENTSFGDESPDMIHGLIGAAIDLTFRKDASPSDAVADLRSAALDQNAADEEIEIEYAPDGNAPGGPTEVITFTAMVDGQDGYELTASTGDPQEQSVSLTVSDGEKPQIVNAFS